MNHNFPIFTVENECQDCYKCVRHCPCKAIKVVNGSASVMPELCVACGHCVKVCPAKAKCIRPDLSRARFLLSRKPRVFASIAPSYVSFFRNTDRKALVGAIKKLGFAGVSETALGAQIVSAETGKLLQETDRGTFISSACPAAVDYIRKYIPEMADKITPVLSPLLSHAKFLRKTYGDDIGIIFFGPCAAKKQEADRHSDILDLALTFEDPTMWMEQDGVSPGDSSIPEGDFEPEFAAEGRVYSIEGGMNETLRGNPDDNTYYISVSGLNNIERILGDIKGDLPHDIRLFIECLACAGGCVNGPAMPRHGSDLAALLATAKQFPHRNSLAREVPVRIAEAVQPDPPVEPEVSEEQILAALSMVGKHTLADELNCGGCGYPTCRDFARALVIGKAEIPMCLSNLRRLSQKKSNALIRYIPSGVVIVDRHLQIIECNELFANLFDESTSLAYQATPGLPGVDISNIVDFTELFEAALASGGDLVRENHMLGDKIFNINVFTIEPHHIVGAIVQDVTQSEMRREHISQKAREVIQKNVFTVQQIAKALGEHMAETEILLREVASGYQKTGSGPSNGDSSNGL